MSRSERYKKRCAADGDESGMVDESNPLPDFIDPITLDPVIAPAISPYGHVMGLATWKVPYKCLCCLSKCCFYQPESYVLLSTRDAASRCVSAR